MLRITRRTPSGDEGIALVVAMAVVMLVTIMVVTVTTIAIYQSGATGRDRQRSSAVASAEGLVDSLAAQVSESAPADLPCGEQDETGTVVRDTLTSVAEVRYMDIDENPIDCLDVEAGVQASFASISVTTTADVIGQGIPARRTVETLIRLTPLYSTKLDKALFSNTGIAIGNNGDIMDSTDGPADVYTNGTIYNDSGGNQVVEGSLLSQGNINWTKQLTVKGDVWAKGSVALTHNSGGGGVLVTGSVLSSTSNVTLSNKVTVQKDVEAEGTIAWTGCDDNCFAPVSVDDPPYTAIPPITWASVADWQANGYGTVVRFGAGGAACGTASSKLDNAGSWIVNNAAGLTQPTILISDCPEPVKIDGPTVTLGNDLAVFSRSGFTLRSMTFAGNSSTLANDPRLLYLIQPQDVTCSGTSITLNSKVIATSRIKTLLYSKCAITLDQQTDITGQIYAGGTITVSNNSNVTYGSLDAWSAGASTDIVAYRVETLYKRENQS